MTNLKNKNKILLFTLEYPPFKGGVANVYKNIVERRPADEIVVLTGKKLTKPHWLFSLWHLWQAVRKYNIKTVLVGHILPLGAVAWLLRKIVNPASRLDGAGFDYLVFLHGMDFTFAIKSARKQWLTKQILREAKKIICFNSYAAGLARDAFPELEAEKIVVVNPGVSRRQLDSQTTRQRGVELKKKYNLENKQVLLQVGRLVKRKGVDKVLEALPDVLRETPELVYVIIGNGPELENIKYLMLNIKNNVFLLTDVNNEELEIWYSLCDIFIMPARAIGEDFEGFGVVYLEANAYGKPVIAGNSGGVRDAVEHGVNGLLVNPENTDEIARAIKKLCQDDELRLKLGKQGRERVERDFNWEKQIASIKAHITSNK